MPGAPGARRFRRRAGARHRPQSPHRQQAGGWPPPQDLIDVTNLESDRAVEEPRGDRRRPEEENGQRSGSRAPIASNVFRPVPVRFSQVGWVSEATHRSIRLSRWVTFRSPSRTHPDAELRSTALLPSATTCFAGSLIPPGHSAGHVYTTVSFATNLSTALGERTFQGWPRSDIVIRGAREHNLRDVSLDLPRGAADLLHRRLGLGQELAGLRHALRRGAAAVRREPLELRPPVPGPDAQARGRPDRRAVAPRSRSSRRPAGATRGRPSARSPRSTTTSASSSPGSARGTAPSCDRPVAAQTREQIVARILELPDGHGLQRARPGDPRPEGRVQGPLRRPRPRRLRPGAGQRPGRPPVRRPRARPPDQAQHRGRDRPAQGRARASGRGWPRRSSRR